MMCINFCYGAVLAWHDLSFHLTMQGLAHVSSCQQYMLAYSCGTKWQKQNGTYYVLDRTSHLRHSRRDIMSQTGRPRWDVPSGRPVLDMTNWKSLGSTGKHWEALGIIENHWEALGSIGNHWESQGSIGKHWESLGIIGNHWEALGIIGKHWKAYHWIPTIPNASWNTLGSSGNSWDPVVLAVILEYLQNHWENLESRNLERGLREHGRVGEIQPQQNTQKHWESLDIWEQYGHMEGMGRKNGERIRFRKGWGGSAIVGQKHGNNSHMGGRGENTWILGNNSHMERFSRFSNS